MHLGCVHHEVRIFFWKILMKKERMKDGKKTHENRYSEVFEGCEFKLLLVVDLPEYLGIFENADFHSGIYSKR